MEKNPDALPTLAAHSGQTKPSPGPDIPSWDEAWLLCLVEKQGPVKCAQTPSVCALCLLVRLPHPHICCPAHNGAVFPPREGARGAGSRGGRGGRLERRSLMPAVDPLGPRSPPPCSRRHLGAGGTAPTREAEALPHGTDIWGRMDN